MLGMAMISNWRTPGRTGALRRAYRLMFAHFGHQRWWPGETPFEVCIGAILTQNTSWSNVERAIANLKVLCEQHLNRYNLGNNSLLLCQAAVLI